MEVWRKITTTLPPPDRFPLVTRLASELNRRAYQLSGGRFGGRFDRAPVCILHHRGAKTGEARETPLVFLRDGDNVVIVASLGGAQKNPAWFHNLRAHPDAEVQIGRQRLPVRARVADPDEREDLWPRLLEVWPGWQDYQDRTERQLPVIVLEPR